MQPEPQPQLSLPKQSRGPWARTERPGQVHVRSKEPTSIYLLLIFKRLVNLLMSPLLCPTEALLQPGLLFLLSFLHLLLEAGDNLRRPQHRERATQRCRATSGTRQGPSTHPQGASGGGRLLPQGQAWGRVLPTGSEGALRLSLREEDAVSAWQPRAGCTSPPCAWPPARKRAAPARPGAPSPVLPRPGEQQGACDSRGAGKAGQALTPEEGRPCLTPFQLKDRGEPQRHIFVPPK